MSVYEIFTSIPIRIAVWVIGVPIIVLLMKSIVRRTRSIAELDRRMKEEEAANAQHPYADMARMYETQQLLDRARKGK
jgi:heme exporter protein D